MKSPRDSERSLRVLVIDDNPAIHEDFKKILQPSAPSTNTLDRMEQELFGATSERGPGVQFRVDSAYQGEEGLARVERGLAEDDPYALAFVDVRMPPGWDGVVTLENLWKVSPDLQAVICTAYSDYSWEEMRERFGERDNLLILRKPFETMEVLQCTHAMTRKWELLRATRSHMESLDRTVRRRTEDLHAAQATLRQVSDERGQVEQALKQSEERFVRAFHASPIPMVIKHAGNRRFLNANPAFLHLTGYRSEELADEKVFQDTTFREHPVFRGGDDAATERLRNHPLAVTRRDKTTRQTLVSTEPMEVEGITCHLLILQDVTEQLALQDRLRQAQKLEAIGLLASGIAHEFNNILTVIQCNAQLIGCGAGMPPQELDRIDQILSASTKAASLTSQLLSFSRKRMLQRRKLDVHRVMNQTHTMLGNLLGERYRFQITLPVKLPPILADEDSLSQVLMNLILNARDAMPEGGALQLEASHALLTETQAIAHPEGRAGSFILIQVRDEGCGMGTEVIRRLFEPFFTTKNVGEGTGLGLSTIHGIVKQHGGWMEVSSKRNRGSTFSVYLPTTDDCCPSSDETAIRRAAGRPRGNGKHLLVVEDEGPLREILSEVLRAHDYQVSEAADGDEALIIHQAATQRIDLLVTDLVMPGRTTGVELARRLTATDPQLKVLFTSGYSPEIVGSDSPLDQGIPFLPKPYEPCRLLEQVHQILAEPIVDPLNLIDPNLTPAQTAEPGFRPTL